AEGWDYFNNYIEEEPIIYRDFEPDSILIYWQKLGPMWIDLDADNEFDDLLMEMHAGGYFCIPEFVTGSNIKICIAEPYSILSEVEEENWETYIGWNGLCIPCANDHYGFRIQNEGDYYYGWFETYNREIHAKNEKRVVHWGFDRTAYCTIPNYPLRWGQIYLDSIGMEGSEWYYEILDDEGNFTYQHLECTGDTVMQDKRPKIIVRSNTHYNRDTITEVTHEYVYEENGKVYWWNKDLQEFTTLYDLTANTGDEWEIKVGTESLTMHVDAVETTEYEGVPYRVIHVSDLEDLFSGEIVVGFGHMTSFFPEKLMNRNANFTVDGLRCYWIGDELIYHNGEEDCDAIYTELHGVEENVGDSFVVYPNPTNGVLTVSMRLPQCDSPTTGQTKYLIINLMGQTILQGSISAENQQIDISSLPAGMYFISVDGETVKFVVK
ncbi:MAG: T9SS type A sorting domain-containing protein, partial [Bacteroidales bacterium]|nr:T9SS type A sorting domain-containing protein [Bacteroidales bacterium]